ncbi:MAG TPA: aldehyde dehydrogenase family protein, partial [Nitrospira sp.]|nr:aldehyde dehydrogenase family protein [Nitrospira sp.]
MTRVPKLRSTVNGESLDGTNLTPDVNPARPAEVVAEVWQADQKLATAAIDEASSAFAGWRSTPSPLRGDILRKAADLLEARAQPISREFSREEGKTVVEAFAEISRAVAILRYFAYQTLEPAGEVYPSHSSRTLLYSTREPLGVVAVITP